MSKKNRENQTTTTQAPVMENTQEQTNDVQVSEQGIENQVEQREVVTTDPVQVAQESATTQPPEVTTTQAPIEAPKKKDIDKDGAQLAVFETRIEWLKVNGTKHEQYVVTVLDNYVQVCSKSVDLNKIAIEQQRLWRMFEYIHNQPTEFRKLFKIVIEFARKYKEEAFSLAKFFRAQSSLTLASDHMAAFNNIRTLILNTAESKDPKSVKSIIDIRKIIEVDCIPEHVRAQYIAFYN